MGESLGLVSRNAHGQARKMTVRHIDASSTFRKPANREGWFRGTSKYDAARERPR
jgi:hypothetical protein